MTGPEKWPSERIPAPEALRPWGETSGPGSYEFQPPRPRRPMLHLLLFLATVATTIVAGAMQQGVDPFLQPALVYKGIPFSFTLLLILGTHEMGHYLVSRRHRLDVTLPFFIPAPPILPIIGPVFIIGTLGAFIRIRSPIGDKRALLDVGCAGPLTGVLVAIPVILAGLSLSHVTVMPLGDIGLTLGEPLLFRLLSWLTFGHLGAEQHILLHPVAFAGWIGLLVTALNLLPVGQLDGGHVFYALFPEYHRLASLGCIGLLVICGVLFWQGWLLWVVLLVFLGIRHPAPYHHWVPLDRQRRVLGLITILVFILTFTPSPFKIEW